MEETDQPQDFIIWINKQAKIVTFQSMEGYERLTFPTQEEKLSYIYRLCEAGYRIL